QDLIIVKPLHLVVDISRLSQSRLRKRLEIEQVDPPGNSPPRDPFLEGDPRFVRRKRWALDSFMNYSRCPSREVSFELVGLALRPKRREKPVLIVGERDPPKIEIWRLENRVITQNREFVQICQGLAACRIDARGLSG